MRGQQTRHREAKRSTRRGRGREGGRKSRRRSRGGGRILPPPPPAIPATRSTNHNSLNGRNGPGLFAMPGSRHSSCETLGRQILGSCHSGCPFFRTTLAKHLAAKARQSSCKPDPSSSRRGRGRSPSRAHWGPSPSVAVELEHTYIAYNSKFEQHISLSELKLARAVRPERYCMQAGCAHGKAN